MLEISQNLIHKLTARIIRRPDSETEMTVMELIKGILCDQMSSMFGVSSPWSVFSKGGSISDKDNSVNGKIASIAIENGISMWALTAKVKDPSYNRRRWIYYIGLREQDDSSAQLFYAKCYYDHMAGSVSVPKPVEQIRDPFPDPLFFDDQVQCMCGKYPLPLEACVLSHTTLPRFINFLQDDTRRIPLILITCPWRISPEILQDKMIGNAIIFWCEDSSVVMRLNSILPKNMYTPWESVRVFVPLAGENVFHPLYTCDDIRAAGDQALASGLIQAFCQSFRSEDVRGFVTIDDISRLRDKQYIELLLNQAKEKSAENQSLKQQCDVLRAANAETTEKLAALEKRPDLDEYESLMNDLMKETDALRKGISDLSVRLYSCNGSSFQPDGHEQNALLQELAHAIQTYLSCAGRRN